MQYWNGIDLIRVDNLTAWQKIVYLVHTSCLHWLLFHMYPACLIHLDNSIKSPAFAWFKDNSLYIAKQIIFSSVVHFEKWKMYWYHHVFTIIISITKEWVYLHFKNSYFSLVFQEFQCVPRWKSHLHFEKFPHHYQHQLV